MNGNAADLTITVDPQNFRQYVFLDPSPGADTPPSSLADGVSVFEHEIGHALGFVGSKNETTGAVTDGTEFTYDQYVSFEGGQPYFTGPAAEAVYGGPIPLAQGSLSHYGIAGLMNPIITNGAITPISDLDIAILSDTGTPIGLPVEGTEGNDVLAAGDRPAVAELMGGNDTFYGGAAADYIFGDAGNDRLFGGAGNDTLYGGSGNDRLVGGAGDDVLTGEAGIDTFVFAPHGADDTVTDFLVSSASHDKLDLSAFPVFTSLANVLRHTTMADGNAVIALNGTTITLDGVTKHDLVGHAKDFKFHA